MEDNKRKLYDALSQDYDMGTFEQFSSDIQDSSKRRKLYDTIKDEYDLPDFDGFSSQLMGSAAPEEQTVAPAAAKPAQDTSFAKAEVNRSNAKKDGSSMVQGPAAQFMNFDPVGGKKGVSDFKRKMDANVRALDAQHESNMTKLDNMRKASAFGSGKESTFNTDTGKIEEKYRTATGELVDTPMEKAAIDRSVSSEAEVSGDMNAAYEELERINGEIQRRSKEIDEANPTSFATGLASTAPGYDYSMSARINDPELQMLWTAKRSAEDRVKTLEREKFNEGLFKTIGKVIFSQDYMDFGMFDLIDARNMSQYGEAKLQDKALNEAKNTMLESEYESNVAQAKYGENDTFWQRAGYITAQSLPFVAEFFVTGGFSSISSAGTKLGSKVAAKVAAKNKAGDIARWMIKNTGTLAGDIIATTAMANTSGAGKMAADMINNYQGQVIKDEEGNLVFDGGKSWGRSVYEAEVSNILEYFTERLGAHLEGIVPGIAKFVDKRMGASYLSDFYSRISNSSWNKALARGGVNEYPGEVIEEEANILLSHLLIDKTDKDNDTTWKEAFQGKDGKTQIDILGGMFLSIGFMKAPSIAGAVVGGGANKIYNTAQYYTYKHNLDKSDAKAANLMGSDVWGQMRERIDNATNDNIAGVMNDIISDKNIGNANKVAAIKYYVDLMKLRGFNLRTSAQAKDEVAKIGSKDEQPIVANEHEQEVVEAYNRGENANTEDEQRDIFMAYAMAPKDSKEAEVAKAAYDGMVDNIYSKIDTELEVKKSELAEMTHEDGNVYVINMKETDANGEPKQVYLTKGNVVMFADGSGIDHTKSDNIVFYYDPILKKKLSVDPRSDRGIASIVSVTPAEQKIAEYEQEAEQQRADAEKAFKGIVDVKQGQQTVINGQPAVVEAVNGDDVQVRLADGSITNVSLSEMQRLADEAAYSDYIARHGMNGAEAVAETDEEPVAEAQEPMTEEQPSEAPVAEEGAADNALPMDENGNPMWINIAPESAIDYLHNTAELSDEEVADFINANSKEAEKVLSEVMKNKPKMGTDLAKYKADKDSWQAEVDAAQAGVDYWNGVKAVEEARIAEAKAAVEAMEEQAAKIKAESEARIEAERKAEQERIGKEEKAGYSLSNEIDENGRQFVLNSNGDVEFGRIGDETGLSPAPILLSEGLITDPKTNAGYGLMHIEARHGEQIRKAGYDSVVDFVGQVASNYETIKEGKDRNGNKTYLLQLTDKHNNTLVVELSNDGSYWNINTAGIFNNKYASGNNIVYNRHTQINQQAETGEGSLNAEQSGTQTKTSTMPSTSGGKSTNISSNNEKNVEEKSEVAESNAVKNANKLASDYKNTADKADESRKGHRQIEKAKKMLEEAGSEAKIEAEKKADNVDDVNAEDENPAADATSEGADDRNIEADKKEVANIISNFRDLFERNSNGRLSNMMMQDVSINGTGTIAMAKSTAKYMSDEELADYIEKYNKLYDDVRNAGIDNAEEYLANNFESSIDIFVGKKHVPIIDILKDEAAKREAKRSKDSGSKFTEREIGNAVAEQLNSIGVEVHADVMEYQHEYQSAKADKSEASKPQFFTDKDGNRYGFARYGKIYIDPRQIDGEKAIHEYAHLWSKALELNNPEGWQSVVDMLKGSEPVWKGIAEEMQDATDGEIALEIISRYSGKKGGELLDAEIEKLSGDGDIKSVLGNALQNIKKAIQDFWKMVGDFLHINYSTPEQVYDQVVKDFASGVNPRIYIEKAISAKDEEYAKAVESGNEEKAKDIFNGVLKETIGNGAVPYMNVANYRSVQSLAHKVKTGDAAAIKEAADMMAPLVPSNAVLVPMVGHTGVATDMMQLANAIAENTGRPVVDALESDPRDSQYESKKEGVVLSAEELGVRMKSGVEIPDGMMPVVIDNVVGTGNTAMAAVNALGKGVVLSLGSATGQFKRVAELKSANVIERDAEGNLIPLSERFNILQGANIKKQKAEGAYNISESDKAAGEMLDELMMSAGIPMEFDDEAQRVLDMKIAETKKMKAWHGSSAIFDAFDSSHFFEGEGSMVYGAGHYVTNVEETGRLYANIAANTNGIKKNLRTPNDVESERSFIENRIKEAKEWGIQAQVEYWQNELDNLKDSDIDRQLYEVDIPDDNGSNYIDWNTNDPNVLKDIASKTPYYDIIKYGIDRSIIKDFSELYRDISRRSGSNTAASKILNDAGFSGIKVPTGNRNGGDGRGMNYVIFNDNDLRIVNRISFHKVDDYPVYFSNAYRAVEGIKQEKATPEQWLAMLQKNGGLKAGEDKWIGLSDWLKERSADAKRTGANTITKDEVLQYIADNKIEIEEVEYARDLRKWHYGEKGAWLENYDAGYEKDADRGEYRAYVEDKDLGVFYTAEDATDVVMEELGKRPINDTRLTYTTEGLENKKEIALVVPTIEPYNQSDEIHFGDAGDGRAVAWVRFGDVNIDESIIQLNEFEKKMEDKYGVKGRSLRHVVNEEEKAEINRLMKLPSNVTSKVLVIDEIQSKRHQDGREKGYRRDILGEVGLSKVSLPDGRYRFVDVNGNIMARNDNEVGKHDNDFNADYSKPTKEQQNAISEYNRTTHSLNGLSIEESSVPDAPFDKNWYELAMKRMLRYAAENGYDKVAWTTGKQQSDRYNMSAVINHIDRFGDNYYMRRSNGEEIGFKVDEHYGIIADIEDSDYMYLNGKTLEEVFGKQMAQRIKSLDDRESINEGEIATIGGEGMKGFYDRMLPQFMDKYGKKWGVKTGTVTLDLPNKADRVMHSVDVTPEMKESVMEGQPMFFKTEDGDVYGFTMDGKIYIDRRVAGSETRIHEYSHMWCEALRKANPKAWEQLKKLMSKEEDLVDYVKRKYPELTSIDDIMDEVFAQYSGKRGAERLNKEMRAEMEKAEGVFEKAKIRKIFGKIKAMLDIFWDMARDLFSGSVKGISKMSADDFADMAFNDLLNGFNPMKNDRVPARLRDDLMGVHHISEEKLKKALKLGGLANPSMAVVDTRKGYQLEYGDITLIPRFTIIEKQRGRNAGTWTADAWTPTYPTVTSMPGKSTGKAYKSILNDWYSAEPIKEMRDALERRLRYFTYAEDGNSEPRLAYQFLKERGEAPDVQYRKNDTDKDFYSFLVELSEETNIPINELAYSNEYDRVEQYLIDSTIKKERERISGRLNRALETNEEKFVIDQANSRWKDQRGKIDNYIYTTNKYANRPDVEVDAEKTLSEAEFIVNRDSRIRKDYERWVDELRDRLGMEDKVFAGYTPSGNRKFVSNTLENVSRLMNRGGQAGGFGWTGPGTFIAKVSKKANTLEAIKKNKGKIIGIDSSMLHDEAKDHINSEFFDLSQVLNQGYGRFEGVGENRLIELADVKGNVKSYLKREYDVDVDDEWIERYYKLVDFIQNKYPVFYFETKFNRPVEFWEFDSAVVPEGTSDEVIEGLKSHGINVVEYDRTKDGEQERVTMDVANDRYGIKFQKGKTKAQKEVNNITEQENGVLYHTAMTMQSNFMKENGNLPLEMGVFTDNHFVIVNNVSVGNIYPVRAFKIEESKDEIKKELQELVRNEGNEISDSTRRTIEEARSKYGILVYNTDNIGDGGNGVQDADMGGRQQSERGADNALDSGEYISDGLSRIEELDKEYLEKGYSKEGLKQYVQQQLGDGWVVEKGNAKNGGLTSGTAVVATKMDGKFKKDIDEEAGRRFLNDPTKPYDEHRAEVIEEKFGNNDEASYRDGVDFEGETYEERVKAARRAGFTKASYDAYIQRCWNNMVRGAHEAVEKIGLGDIIEILETPEGLTGKKAKAKGWFDPKTGKITIVLFNNSSTDDVVRTIFHECVAHYGMRKLFGDNFDNFLDNVYNNVEANIREEIDDIRSKKNVSQRVATEEYIAKLAEDIDYEGHREIWHRIKMWFLNMLSKLGLKDIITPEVLTDNELKYLLWRSYVNIKEPGRYQNNFGGDNVDRKMQEKYKVGEYAESTFNKPSVVAAEDETLFRDGGPEEDLVTGKVLARDNYDKMLSSTKYQFTEAWQDSMLGLKKLYQSILGNNVRIEDVSDYENAYMAENRMSSMNNAQMNIYNEDFIRPLAREVRNLTGGSKAAYQELTDYMMAKHGLERNEVMARRDASRMAEEKYGEELAEARKAAENDPLDEEARLALESIATEMRNFQQSKYDELRDKDYAGLTALTDTEDVQEAEAKAAEMVDAYEAAHDTAKLWELVNKATAKSLSKLYESGMMNLERYNQIRNMFEYYIPLQGFDEKVAEDAYAYIGSDGTLGYGTPIRKAKGRSSKADDPLATIAMNAEATIRQSNRNLMKQRFLNFVQAHPSDLVSVQDVWLKKNDVNGEWEQVKFEDILKDNENLNDTDSPKEIESKVVEFEKRMEELRKQHPEKYKKSRELPNVPYRVVEAKNMNQHQVVVKRNGVPFMLIVNGNPRAAQALNGLTNPDTASGLFEWIEKNLMKAVRWLSLVRTSMSPEFIESNFLRDAIYSNSMAWVKEGPNYSMKFHENFGKVNPVFLSKMYREWQNGELREKVRRLQYGSRELGKVDQMRVYFDEFMSNGGETGWTQYLDLEANKKKLAKTIKEEGNIALKKIKALEGSLQLIGNSVENTARFAAYVTSRDMGRSIGRSIWDAKEISVNFNKKGAGAKFYNSKNQTGLGSILSVMSGVGRLSYMFFNAAVQSLAQMLKVGSAHPAKFSALIGTLISMGVIAPLLSKLIGGDDDDEYYNLPEYVRRTNICFRFSKDMDFITIPMSQEYRCFYGLGELTTSAILGKEKYSDKAIATKYAEQFSQLLPLDFLEGKGGLYALAPDVLKQEFDISANVGWDGRPIHRDNMYTPNAPEWTTAFKSTNEQAVALTKWMNEITGGDDYTKGAVDINPANLEYRLEYIFGGLASFPNKMIKTVETAMGKREYDPRSIVFLSRVMKPASGNAETGKINNMYFNLLDEYEKTKYSYDNYKKRVEKGEDVIEYAERIDFLENSKEFGHYLVIGRYKPIIDKYNELAKDADEQTAKAYKDAAKELRQECVEMIFALDEGNVGDVNGALVQMLDGIITDENVPEEIADRAEKEQDKFYNWIEERSK